MAEDFILLGGPLHRWAERVGLVRDGTNPSPFGVGLGVTLWIGLLAIAFADGVLGQLFSLTLVSGHVRLLVVIPLLFFAESQAAPRIAGFVRMLVRTGIIAGTARPAFDSTLARIVRVKDSWIPDALCLAAAVAVSVMARHLPLVGATSASDANPGAGAAAATLWWYWLGCLTLFRFLLLRWVVRLVLWGYLLWRISRLDLNLVPSHPDYSAGLGSLESVQTHFLPLVLAISALQSASIAEELAAGTMTFDGIVPAVAFVAVVDLVLFVGPLLFFFAKLWRCRVQGLGDYMYLGSDYVRSFDRKWVRERATQEKPLLGTPDLQSLADLGHSVNVVRSMRAIPTGPRLYSILGVAAAVPLLPLLLFEYPLTDLAAKFFSRLTGF